MLKKLLIPPTPWTSPSIGGRARRRKKNMANLFGSRRALMNSSTAATATYTQKLCARNITSVSTIQTLRCRAKSVPVMTAAQAGALAKANTASVSARITNSDLSSSSMIQQCRMPRCDDARECRVEQKNDEQRYCQHQEPGTAMQESLPCRIAEVVGDQNEREDADDVRHECDRQYAGEDERIVKPAGALHQVKVQQPERGQAEHRVQARARIGDQELVRTDRKQHAGTGDGVARAMNDFLRDRGDMYLQRPRQSVDKESRQRHHENDEQNRKPERTQCLPAAHRKEHTCNDGCERADLEQRDVPGSPKGVEEQPKGKEHEARRGRCRLALHEIAGEYFALFPDQPEDDAQDDRTVR